jgi:hypothetical protein
MAPWARTIILLSLRSNPFLTMTWNSAIYSVGSILGSVPGSTSIMLQDQSISSATRNARDFMSDFS